MRNVESVIFGPPTLEDKLRAVVREEKQYRDAQHADNQLQFRQLFRLVYIGVGIVITLQVILLAIVAVYKH